MGGRPAECAQLDRLLEAARSGQSAVLVLRGEAGIGKSILVGYAAERGEDCTVLRAVGVESERELPFAALHQLCALLLDALSRRRLSGTLCDRVRPESGTRADCSSSAWRCSASSGSARVFLCLSTMPTG